ncbi:hypothetical protein M5G25_00305 [Pseudomonas sp. TNT2022 ID357]|uniref:Cysteine-rich KTR n=1 Tax=Pseudomonas idahonensis TaxID=2942628 RepID=A0ABT5PXP5_9PSED|nr:hypothetical protein [Pseudomonas idahonensis]MDD1146703.1 hypothetical protein [Pseudomonas idahonensis]
MPIAPQPFTLACQCCSWRKTFLPSSDVLVLNRDWFSHCPTCNTPSPHRRAATLKEALKTRLEQFLTPHG